MAHLPLGDRRAVGLVNDDQIVGRIDDDELAFRAVGPEASRR